MIKSDLAYAIPLLLAEKLEEVRGKTRMQKLIYFIEQKAHKKKLLDFTYNYELSHYGPFSLDLAHVLYDLIDRKQIEVQLVDIPDGRMLYVYTLTKRGRDFLNSLQNSNKFPKELNEIIEEIGKKFGSLALPLLVTKAYEKMAEEEPEILSSKTAYEMMYGTDW